VVLFLVVALAIEVVPVVVVILIGGVELLLIGVVGDEMGGVVTLEAASR
jgi:hypothetical protein